MLTEIELFFIMVGVDMDYKKLQYAMDQEKKKGT